MITGYFVADQRGEFYYKTNNSAAAKPSDLIVSTWPCDTESKFLRFIILVEAIAAGVRIKHIRRYAQAWQCTDVEAFTYAEHAGVALYFDAAEAAEKCWRASRDSIFAAGPTAIEAMGNLCGMFGGKLPAVKP